MNIQFNTETLQGAEAQGLISLLSALFALPTTVSLTTQPPVPTTEEQAIFGVPVGSSTGISAVIAQDTEDQATQYAPSGLAIVGAGMKEDPAPAPEAHKRTRRTKAQIEADEAAEKGSAVAASQVTSTDPTQGSAVTNAAASGTTQSATASPTTASVPEAKPITADELRALLNGYISKHSMDEAIGKLREFGCNRVTEALSLDPVKLGELAEALRG
jgi:hypothetical protein